MRRNIVLEHMYEQGYITHEQFEEGRQQALPSPNDIEPPKLDSKAPYFTAWLRQQLVERYGASKAFFGGLKVKSTLDLRLQGAAEEAVNSYLGYSPATASVVVLDNKNAGVKAMVGGPNFETKPFNLATQGHRQPGSSIKPFTLITALEEGISPYTTFESAPQYIHYGKNDEEVFEVNNDEDSYLGSCDIVCATTYSDNSIYAQLGLEALKGKTIQDRTHSIAGTIHKAGYDDPISTNPSMVLGGLEVGVTPLGWTYAYSTIGNNGDRVSGTLAPRPGDSPVAYTQVTDQRRPHDQGRRQRLDPHPGDLRRRRRRSEGHPRNGGQQRHRHQRPDRRLGPVGQDGHDREQRRRLVLRRHRRRSDRLRLGRLRRHHDIDDDPLQRRPGDGRHLPGADLGQRDVGLRGNQGRTRGRSEGRQGKQAVTPARSSGSTYTSPESSGEAEVESEASEASEPAEEAPEAPEAAEPAEPAAPEPSEPAAPSSGGGVTAG